MKATVLRGLYVLVVVGLAVKLYDCQREREFWRIVANTKQRHQPLPFPAVPDMAYLNFDMIRNSNDKPMVRLCQ